MSAASRPPVRRLRRFVAEINKVLLAEAHLASMPAVIDSEIVTVMPALPYAGRQGLA
jgi:hypothetical protein